jgi:hypothetical protein
MGNGLPPAPKANLYQVKLRCVTVDTMEAVGTCEAQAVDAAIQSFERRTSGYESVESLSLETKLLPGDHVSMKDPDQR